MDTVWFAVDADGHIAQFDSGEAGAVPVEGYTEDWGSLQDALRKAVTSGQTVYELEGRAEPERGLHQWRAENAEHWRDWPVLMFLLDLERVQPHVSSGLARIVPARPTAAVLFSKLPADAARSLHEDGACLGCFLHFNRDEEEFQPAEHGLFGYSHTCENWISGPYGRHENPDKAVTLASLPPELQEAIGRVRFESLCFHETPYIQPVEHVSCESWETEYLALDMKTTKPMPGSEGAEREDEAPQTGASETGRAAPPKDRGPASAAAAPAGGLLSRLLKLFRKD
jgi:hypothetical protein